MAGLTSADRVAGEPATPLPRHDVAVRVTDVSKRFGSLVANHKVSFHVDRGTIHAIVGENGAGKTTIMRILYGLYRPDEGTIEIDGQPVVLRSPADGVAAGVGMVHQQSLLLTQLTVAENVLLGLRRSQRITHQEVVTRLQRISDDNQLRMDPKAKVATLSVAARQRAELLIALYHEASVIILDEPTTILTPQEVEQLFVTLRQLRQKDCTTLLVTHKLREMMEISDDVTVLRRGEVVLSKPMSVMSRETLTAAILGIEPAPAPAGHPPGGSQAESVAPVAAPAGDAPVSAGTGSARLSVRGLTVGPGKGVPAVDDVSFDARPGEIVAITGIEDNGQREVAEALLGLVVPKKGQIDVNGLDLTGSSVRRRRQAGVGYVPEDRVGVGVAMDLSVAENVAAGAQRSPEFSHHGLRDSGAWRRAADALVSKYRVVSSSVKAPMSSLSGGNAQKVVVGREIDRRPSLLVVSQPTQGLDLASTELIWNELRAVRAGGGTVMLVSTDFSEVCALADRALVMRAGRLVGEIAGRELTEEAIGRLAIGADG